MSSSAHRRRKLLVFGLLAFLVGGQAWAMITQEEHWPFSPYPMYADVNATPTIRMTRLIGLTPAPEHRELTMDAAWLRKEFARAARHPQAHERLQRLMRTYVKHYGWTNPVDPTGKPLEAFRVYEQVWYLRPDAGNRQQPDENRLLAEYPHPDLAPATRPATDATSRPSSARAGDDVTDARAQAGGAPAPRAAGALR